MAEIDRRMQELRPTNTHKMQVGEKMDRDVLMWLNALTWVKKVIGTLEVKEGLKGEKKEEKMDDKEENKDNCSDCPFNDTSCPGGMWCTEDE